MEESDTLEILKQAILLERRGESFYRSVSEKTENTAVRDFFEMMAEEEQKHANSLSEQFKSYCSGKKFLKCDYEDTSDSRIVSKVLTREIKDNISAAGFEAAAISAAISIEEHAVKLYSKSSENTTDTDAKALYDWLARWERGHLNLLLEIDKALREKIWFDNSFWPF
ncbi:MAG: ferritin family protein [Proteobacteria bacterium]|nr:ferritin family protein [Pseudomonadota bacterium]